MVQRTNQRGDGISHCDNAAFLTHSGRGKGRRSGGGEGWRVSSDASPRPPAAHVKSFYPLGITVPRYTSVPESMIEECAKKVEGSGDESWKGIEKQPYLSLVGSLFSSALPHRLRQGRGLRRIWMGRGPRSAEDFSDFVRGASLQISCLSRWRRKSSVATAHPTLSPAAAAPGISATRLVRRG